MAGATPPVHQAVSGRRSRDRRFRPCRLSCPPARCQSRDSYFGEVFDRPFPESLPRWDDEAASGTDLWATEHETREEIIDFYRRVSEHSDATINALPIDAPGYVPWWPRPDVKLFNILVHILTETNRHAGHADILREQLDGAVGAHPQGASLPEYDAAYWENHRAKIEQAAKAADPANA